MCRRSIPLIILLLLVLPRPAGAQVAAAPPLSLRQAVDEAVRRNPELAALRAEVDVQRPVPQQQGSLPPPVAEAQVWQWPLDTLNPSRPNMYMFMLTQELPGRGKRALRVALAEKDVAVSESLIAGRTSEVIDRVKQAYAELFVSRKAGEIDRSTADLLRQLADVAQAKYETGRISQQDVLKPIVELSRLHGELLNVAQAGDLARSRLNALMNRPPGDPIGPLAESGELEVTATSRELQDLAVGRHPELRTASLQTARAEAALALTRRDLEPDFTVQGGYMLMPHDTDAWMGRIGVTWPGAPWARRGIAARIAQREAAVTAAHAQRSVAENAIRLAVEDAYVRAKGAQQRAALLRTTILPQSQQTLDVSRIAYQVDRVEFLALLDNERMLLDARLSYYRALTEQDQALADLERAVGAELAPTAVRPVSLAEVK